MVIAGKDIGINVFLSMEEENPLGICIFHDHGASVITLEEFMKESRIDLSPQMCQRYACAFEVMAKQLRGRR